MANATTGKADRTLRNPLYKQIANVLRDEIRTKYNPQDSLPPQRQLAERFNASYLTVNNAIRELVQEGLVTRTVGHGTYVCDQKNTSRGLISILTSVSQQHLAQMIAKIERELGKSRFRPVLFGGHVNFEEERRAFEEMGQFKEAGAIIYSMFARRVLPQIKALLAHGVPVVTINWHVKGCDCARVDHRQVGRLQAKYVMDQNCRRILYIGNRLPTDLKLLGFLSALAEKGCAVDPIRLAYLAVEPGDAGEQQLHHHIGQIVRKAFSEPGAPDAVVVTGVRYLEPVVAELRPLGVVPGKDVKLAGTDMENVRGFPYATVDENWGQIGRHAARMLLDRIEGKYTGPPRTQSVEPRLVVYE